MRMGGKVGYTEPLDYNHAIPVSGQIVRVRTRMWLVESIEPINGAVSETVVSLAYLDDDAQGDKLDVVWGLELDTEILGTEAWQSIGRKGFDDPRFFSACSRLF
jgi:hypothetical protein